MLFYIQGIDHITKTVFNKNIEYFSISFDVPTSAAHDANLFYADH
jgi:hypothetical protein